MPDPVLVLTVSKKNEDSIYSTAIYTTDGSTRSTISAIEGKEVVSDWFIVGVGSTVGVGDEVIDGTGDDVPA